ncbi:MAG: hypothetical protein DRR16_33415 [Candidatus Parabeggiatoa sp. nov. 3]|jgi:hypothetical protein|nr:MAG: hypothetical protein DRR16_33415 [Gammaproteobacteria bacterium]
MTQYTNKLSEGLKLLLGKKLKKVIASIFSFEGVLNMESPQAVLLQFEDNRRLVFYPASDGVSLDCDHKTLSPLDLGEYGKEIIMEVSQLSLWQYALGEVLTEAYVIFSHVEENAVGIKMHFNNSSIIIIINCGDDIYVWDEEHFCEVFKNEKISEINVCF